MRIPDKKREAVKDAYKGSPNFAETARFIDLLGDANIPYHYWFLKSDTFPGSKNILAATKKYISDLGGRYTAGDGLIYSGSYGTGKTFALCTILKHALKNNYGAYYTTMSEMPIYYGKSSYQDEFYHTCTRVDFLAIDEVDSRHISQSEDSQAFFGAMFEKIFRYRKQNGLPTLLATNHSAIQTAFSGQYARVVESLVATNMEVVPALGKDNRKDK